MEFCLLPVAADLCDDVFRTEPSWLKVDKDKDGVLGGKFHFKKLPEGSLEKTKVICTVCKVEFNYHRSNSSLA